ncbi:MAG: hypothetical protein K6U80_06735 [Firmicutes bacterium]|nr:hypothetical protein [Bacillota bacterium]
MGMSKAALAEIVNQKLILEFCLSVLLYLVFWRVTFKLGGLILDVKTGFGRILPAVAGMTLFSVFVQPLVSSPFDIIVGPLTVALVMSSLYICVGSPWYEAFWTAIPIISYGLVGDTAVITWCRLGGHNATVFFLDTPWGAIVAVLFKLIFVTAGLLIMPRLNLSLIPLKGRKPDKGTFFFQGGAFMMCFFQLLFMKSNLPSDPQSVDLLMVWIGMSFPIIGQLWLVEIVKRMIKLDQEILGWEIFNIYRKNQDLKFEEYYPVLLEAYNIGPEEAAAAVKSIYPKPEERGNSGAEEVGSEK